MQPAQGPATAPQRIDNLARQRLLRVVRRAEQLRDALFRRAEIANPARPPAIRHIAKMPHQTRHPALAALRIPDHRFNLRLFLCALRYIRTAPFLRAEAHIIRRVDDRAAVRPKLLQRLAEHIRP
jgi:hypothetical protein